MRAGPRCSCSKAAPSISRPWWLRLNRPVWKCGWTYIFHFAAAGEQVAQALDARPAGAWLFPRTGLVRHACHPSGRSGSIRPVCNGTSSRRWAGWDC